MRLLLVEDDPTQAAYLSKGLKQAGYAVDHASNGREGLFLATGEPYDVLVVDRMIPQLEGLALISALRAAQIVTPALVISALGQVDDRIQGLRAGGDDYLVKPFAFEELLARLEAITRRAQTRQSHPKAADAPLQVADLLLHRLSRKVSRAGVDIDLKPQEFRLLEFLLKHSGQVVTRTMLLEGVWDYHFDPQTNVIDVYMSRLRSKIDKGSDKPLIHTLRGAGYRLGE